MNKGVAIGGGVGLLLLLGLGGYWIAMRQPQPQPLVQDMVRSTTTPSRTVESSAASVSPGTAPVRPPVQSPSSSTGSLNAGITTPTTVAPYPPAPGNAASAQLSESALKKPLTREERQKIRAQVNIKTQQLLAKGQNVTLKDTQTYLNDVEKLGQGIFDPRYFNVMREMVGYSAKTQELSLELKKIANSREPKDIARQQAILAEMRDLSDRISHAATALQSYARDAVMVKTP